MSSELMKWSTGEVAPQRSDKKVAKVAKGIYDRTRLAGFDVEAASALTRHIMDQVVELDEYRRSLAGSDPALNAVLVDVELNAVRNFKRTQDRFSNGWKL